MKIVVVFAFLIASITAVPDIQGDPADLPENKAVLEAVGEVLDFVSNKIQDLGLDPFHIDKIEYYFEHSVPVFFNVNASLKDINAKGFSNIVIHKLRYSMLRSRLIFQVELPLLNFSVGAGSLEATLFGPKFDAKGSGYVNAWGITVGGQLRIKAGAWSGIHISKADITFGLQGIDSNINLVIQGRNFSGQINNLLNSIIPYDFKFRDSELNDFIGFVLSTLGDPTTVFFSFFDYYS